MSAAVQPLRDFTYHGARTVLRGVKAAGVESRPWISPFPVCPALNQHQFAHVGLLEAVYPYQIVRTRQNSTYFLACYQGRGEVLIDGRWRTCGKGMACLLPAHALNAFRAIAGIKWEFCWACYVQPSDQRFCFHTTTPVLARYDAEPLRLAIQGLIHECRHNPGPGTTQRWADLIQDYVMRFARPASADQRLITLWERVTQALGECWTLDELARASGYSKEHLRRLCHRELGRSPIHHVIFLRMRRASELLSTTNNKVEAVARAVGYNNPFVFSNAFQKWVGWRPSEYRRK
jgi:AraC-like DNA-binding protein